MTAKSARIRLGWKWLVVTNTLTYNLLVIFIGVKSVVVETRTQNFFYGCTQ